MDIMNTIFLVTGETPDHVKTVGQWLANRVSNVYHSIEEVGNSIPEMPVAVLVEGELTGIVQKLKKVSKSDIAHIHVGSDTANKANGAKRLYHVECGKKIRARDVGVLMRLEAVWRSERMNGRPGNDRSPIKVP